MAANHPILRIAPSAITTRIKGRRPTIPSRQIPVGRQGSRLGGKFSDIESNLSGERLSLIDNPSAVAPERALVFEIFGILTDFVRAAAALDLEWLGEFDTRFDDEEDLFPAKKTGEEDEEGAEPDLDEGERPGSMIDGRLYLSMPTETSLRKLLRLWNKFKSGKEASSSQEKLWWTLFKQLKDLRVWSAEDRIDETTQRYLRVSIAEADGRPIRIEVDLWYYGEKEKRAAAFEALRSEVAHLGGETLDYAEIEEINYCAALVSIPLDQAEELERRAGRLAIFTEVMQIRPQTAFTYAPPENPETSASMVRPIAETLDSRPIIAGMLDGVPLANHELLRNRIDILPLDVPEAAVTVANRWHGTQMASLILHGDLYANEAPIDRVLQIVPVLQMGAGGREVISPDKLPLAMINRAVQEMVSGRQDQESPTKIVIMNHAIADENSPFAGRISPWARLLDFLAFKHKLLFVVSAGNIRSKIPVPGYSSVPQFTGDDPTARSARILLAVEAEKGTRGILSPAETINNITVGAVHADGSAEIPPNLVNPYENRMTQLTSAVGLGYRGMIKPDFVATGGRQVARPHGTSGDFYILGDSARGVGTLGAAPDRSGATNLQETSSGTSNAAALATRSLLQIADALDDVFQGETPNWHDRETRAVMLKALVAHGCSWGSIGRVLESSYPPPGTAGHLAVARRLTASRFLGYGEIDSTRVVEGNRYRATMIGEGAIGDDERHEYRVPLPQELLKARHPRRLVLTLAWQTPIQPLSQYYQSFKLRIADQDGKRKFWQGVKNTGENLKQPPARATEKGTLFHLILEGANATSLTSDGTICVGVQAMAYGKAKFDNLKVPYALAMTLEVEESIRSDVYAYVRQELGARVQPAVRARVR